MKQKNTKDYSDGWSDEDLDETNPWNEDDEWGDEDED